MSINNQVGSSQKEYNGIYIGYVRDNADKQKDGRLGIYIPSMGNLPDNPDGWTWCSYLSPFAGQTEKWSVGSDDTKFNQTQTSYGFWMVPPDIDAQVAVFFANGNPQRGYWFGSTYQELSNYSVPGIAGSTNNYAPVERNLPVAEHNKKTVRTPKVDNTRRPVNDVVAKGIRDQGLIDDPYRGVSSSSAKREAPSQVYGISTPGPNLPGSTKRRTGGHQLVMDDKEGNEHFTIRTKSGAQIKVDETNGITYIINKKGTAWVQLDEDGNVDIFSAKTMSIRSQEDINFRADRDINIEAGNNINIKAVKDWSGTSGTDILGEFAGAGGNIKIQANENFDLVVAVNSKATTGGNVDVLTTGNNKVTAGGNTDIKSGGYHNQESGTDTNIKAGGKVNIESGTDTNVNAGANLNQESTATTNIKAGAAIMNQAGGTFSALAGPAVTLSAGAINLNGPPAPPAGSAGSSTAAADAAEATKPETEPKTNILEAFKSEEPSQINYYVRERQEIKTVASRFPTYEPCPDHVKK